MPDAYYLPAGEGRFEPTEATSSPWDEASQHGGPPAALLATCIDRLAGAGDLRLSRMTVEFLRPIPRRTVTVDARLVRPGRRVAMTDATMAVDGEPVVLARAWHIAAGAPVPVAPRDPVPPLPDAEDGLRGPLGTWGYGRSVEWRFTSGGYDEVGPADVWTRVRLPLVAGDDLLPYQRMLLVADSANGISGELPFGEWLFVPPGVTVTMLRHPAGEWVFMSARTHLGGDGTGLTLAALADGEGLLGTVSQPLLVAPR